MKKLLILLTFISFGLHAQVDKKTSQYPVANTLVGANLFGYTGSTNYQYPSSLFSSLPSMTGQSGKYLSTDGVNALWSSVNSAIWGNITGTLSNQTDLQTALNLKQNISGLGTLAFLNSINNSNWSGTALADGNIASSSTWNTKQNAITFGTGVQTALGVNIGSAGAFTTFNGAGGAPSSLTLTNATGLPAASIVAGSLVNGMTATTQTPGDNSTKIATTAYADNAVSNNTPATLGNIITETWANLSNWTNVGGATFTVSGNQLTCNGGTPGTPTLNAYIKQTAYGISNLENFGIKWTEIVGTINTTSFGPLVGIQNVGALGGTSIAAGILLNTANKGQIVFYLNQNSASPSVASVGTLPINTNDVLTCYLRRIKGRFTLEVTNTTTNPGASLAFSFDYSFGDGAGFSPGPFDYSIYAAGGTDHKIDTNFKVNSETTINANNMYVGDSEITGYFNGVFVNRAADILNNNYTTFIVNGNPGAKVEDIKASEVIAHTPKKIILSIGVNNLGTGDSPATTMTKLATLIGSLSGYSMGTNLFITTLRACNTTDVTALNTLIRSTYPTSYIELFYPSWSGTSFTGNTNFIASDGVHYNAAWAKLEADILANYFSLTPKQTVNTNQFTVNYSNGLVGIGPNNTNYTPTQVLGVVNSTGDSPIGVGVGGYITSTAIGEIFISGGARFKSSSWNATTTTANLIGASAGVTYFAVNTGLTPSANFTPTYRMNLTATGLAVGQSVTAATSTLQSGGSFSAAYVAKTATYPITATDYTIECTANSFTVTLPTAVGITGRIYNISNSGAGTITIATTSSQTFINVTATPTTLTLATVGNVTVQSNGANWLQLK